MVSDFANTPWHQDILSAGQVWNIGCCRNKALSFTSGTNQITINPYITTLQRLYIILFYVQFQFLRDTWVSCTWQLHSSNVSELIMLVSFLRKLLSGRISNKVYYLDVAYASCIKGMLILGWWCYKKITRAVGDVLASLDTTGSRQYIIDIGKVQDMQWP